MKELLSIPDKPTYALVKVKVRIDGVAAQQRKYSYPDVMREAIKFAQASIPGATCATSNEIDKNVCVVRMRVPVHVPTEMVGGFDLEDYITMAKETDHDLSEEQVKEAMEYSRTKLFDASIGLDWDTLKKHIEMWLEYISEGPDHEDGPEFEGWAERSGESKEAPE